MATNNVVNITSPFISEWVAYTPTFTGFGTAASISFFSRRVGDVLEIKGRFTSGTSTATEARITIGYNGTSANVSSDATIVPSIRVAGVTAWDTANASMGFVLIESNVTYMTFGKNDSLRAALTKLNGNTTTANGWVMSVHASIPVTTWP